MKKILRMGILLFLGLLLAGCNNFAQNLPQQVEITAVIKNLTDEDYDEVGTAGLENPVKADFKKFVLHVEIKNTEQVSQKKLEVPEEPDYKRALDRDRERVWFGDSFYQNNDDEKYSMAEQTFVFYAKGLDEDEIYDALSPLSVQIGWVDQEGNKTEKTYRLGQILSFEER